MKNTNSDDVRLGCPIAAAIIVLLALGLVITCSIANGCESNYIKARGSLPKPPIQLIASGNLTKTTDEYGVMHYYVNGVAVSDNKLLKILSTGEYIDKQLLIEGQQYDLYHVYDVQVVKDGKVLGDPTYLTVDYLAIDIPHNSDNTTY